MDPKAMEELKKKFNSLNSKKVEPSQNKKIMKLRKIIL